MSQSALLALLLAAQAAPAPPAAETVEQAIDRIFYPTFQLKGMLSGPLDRHEVTRNAFAALGRERACVAYRQAWRGAFDRHLLAWKAAYRSAVLSVVPQQALFTEPRRFMDPAVTDAYSSRVVAALRASDTISIVRAMGNEILGALQAAAADSPPAQGWGGIDATAPGGLHLICGMTVEYLDGRY
ncbi:MAG TPA: hypothetical protein VEW04_09020 [Allosphingosinicella sp.]|nr:hypothetical protein [Allosphingosinicella sp.]